MRWSGPWTIVGRTLVANRLLAGSACGKRQRGRPLNAIVRRHQGAASREERAEGFNRPYSVDSLSGGLRWAARVDHISWLARPCEWRAPRSLGACHLRGPGGISAIHSEAPHGDNREA